MQQRLLAMEANVLYHSDLFPALLGAASRLISPKELAEVVARASWCLCRRKQILAPMFVRDGRRFLPALLADAEPTALAAVQAAYAQIDPNQPPTEMAPG